MDRKFGPWKNPNSPYPQRNPNDKTFWHPNPQPRKNWPPQNKPQRQKPDNKTLCNNFLRGSCTNGEYCMNLHQFSLDYDIEGQKFGEINITSDNKNQNGLISMDIYDTNSQTEEIAVVVCTRTELMLHVLPNGKKMTIPIPNDSTLTAMHCNSYNKVIFLAFYDEATGAGIRIYQDKGDGNLQEIVTKTNLHSQDITAIQTQNADEGLHLVTGSKDGYINLWSIKDDLVFNRIGVAVSKLPIYSLLCLEKYLLAGSQGGKVQVFTPSPDSKDLKVDQIIDVDADSESIVTRLIAIGNAVYATTWCNKGENGTSGQMGFLIETKEEKISHLVSISLPCGALTLEYMPELDVIFIGFANGRLEFRDREGYVKKGEGLMHRGPIRRIRQLNNNFLVADEKGGFSWWTVIDEVKAKQKKEAHKIKFENAQKKI